MGSILDLELSLSIAQAFLCRWISSEAQMFPLSLCLHLSFTALSIHLFCLAPPLSWNLFCQINDILNMKFNRNMSHCYFYYHRLLYLFWTLHYAKILYSHVIWFSQGHYKVYVFKHILLMKRWCSQRILRAVCILHDTRRVVDTYYYRLHNTKSAGHCNLWFLVCPCRFSSYKCTIWQLTMERLCMWGSRT